MLQGVSEWTATSNPLYAQKCHFLGIWCLCELWTTKRVVSLWTVTCCTGVKRACCGVNSNSSLVTQVNENWLLTWPELKWRKRQSSGQVYGTEVGRPTLTWTAWFYQQSPRLHKEESHDILAMESFLCPCHTALTIGDFVDAWPFLTTVPQFKFPLDKTLVEKLKVLKKRNKHFICSRLISF